MNLKDFAKTVVLSVVGAAILLSFTVESAREAKGWLERTA